MLIFATLLLIAFIFWQFKMFQKYTLQYDSFKINMPKRYISIKGETISFSEIDHITIIELEQPGTLEKALSKSAYHAYLTQMMFHLKNETVISCRFNSKHALYKTLKQLQPFIPVYADIEQYKTSVHWRILFFISMMILGVLFALTLK